jgi:hypothetical protein
MSGLNIIYLKHFLMLVSCITFKKNYRSGFVPLILLLHMKTA